MWHHGWHEQTKDNDNISKHVISMTTARCDAMEYTILVHDIMPKQHKTMYSENMQWMYQLNHHDG